MRFLVAALWGCATCVIGCSSSPNAAAPEGPDAALGCGRTSERCCGGSLCDDGLTCVSGRCGVPVECGRASQPCCSGDACAGSLVCEAGECAVREACGAERQPCCEGTCRSGLVCDRERCGRPAACGALREVCCGESSCASGLRCAEGRCAVVDACGEIGEPCCAGDLCAEGRCTDGSCERDDRLRCAGSSCGDCTGESGCGWCMTTSICATGDASGPGVGTCDDWAWEPSACAPRAPCSTGSSSCEACAPLAGCGWCQSSGTCRPSRDSTVCGDWWPDECPGDAGCDSTVVASRTCGTEATPPCVSFEDVTATSGVTIELPRRFHDEGDVAAVADLDDDGHLDIVRTAEEHLRVFHNAGDGTFLEVSEAWGLGDARGEHTVVVADVDGDGRLDILALGATEGGIYRQTGSGFEVMPDALPLSAILPASTAAFADYDADGDLDLFVTIRFSHDVIGRLLQNDGTGHFEDVSSTGGPFDITVAGWTEDSRAAPFQAVWFDYDTDGDPDLAVANDKGPYLGLTTQLFRNDGGSFIDVSIPARIDYFLAGMGIAVADFDDNGYPDLYVTNFAHYPVLGFGNQLYLNRGDSTFQEMSATRGVATLHVGWGASPVDIDLDGDLDLLVAGGPHMPGMITGRLYENLGRAFFRDITDRAGLGAELGGYSYGSAAADFDGDGAPDLLLTHSAGGMPTTIYRNRSPSGHWLRVRLRGRAPNTGAIGAAIETYANGHQQARWVAAGTGYAGSEPPETILGFGNATVVERLTIRWPSGHSTELRCVDTNRELVIVED